MKQLRYIFLSALLLALNSCDEQVDYTYQPDSGADARGHSSPTAAIQHANFSLQNELPFSDQRDFEDARRGLIATDPGLLVKSTSGDAVWNPSSYGIIEGASPASVNPSLWRQASLKETIMSDELEIEGSTLDLLSFFSLFEKPSGTFNIVTPWTWRAGSDT